MRENSQRQHLIIWILYSDWFILEYKYKHKKRTRKFLWPWDQISFKLVLYIYNACTYFTHNQNGKGPSSSWSYDSWIYNYRCSQCLSSLKLWVQIPLRQGVLDTTLCDKVCQWLPECRWFSPSTPVASTNKTDLHDITEILLKVALNTINPPLPPHNQT